MWSENFKNIVFYYRSEDPSLIQVTQCKSSKLGTLESEDWFSNAICLHLQKFLSIQQNGKILVSIKTGRH